VVRAREEKANGLNWCFSQIRDYAMNKKQLICMWCGIVAVMLCAFVTIVSAYYPDYAYFGVWVLLITLVTCALIYTFKDKKRPEGEREKPTDLRRGFRRVILLLSLLSASVFLIVGIINALAGEWGDVPSCLIGASASFAGVWVVYGIIRCVITPVACWLVKGFRGDTR